MFKLSTIPNRFEIDGFAARQAQRHLAKFRHVTFDPRLPIFCSCTLRRSERLVKRLSYSYMSWFCGGRGSDLTWWSATGEVNVSGKQVSALL